jgi:hypothetical protein
MLRSIEKLSKSYSFLILIDLIRGSVIFLSLNYLKNEKLSLTDEFQSLLFLAISIWIIVSIYNAKYRSIRKSDRNAYFRATIWTFGHTLFFVTFAISILGLLSVSRLFVIQFLTLLVVSDFIVGFFLERSEGSGLGDNQKGVTGKKYRELVKLSYIIPSAVWISVVFFLLVWLKTSRIYYYDGFENILLVLYASWALAITITYKYSTIVRDNIYYHLSPYVKSGIVTTLFASLFYYFFRLEPLSRYLLFGTIVGHAILETLAMVFVYYIKQEGDKARTRNLDEQPIIHQYDLNSNHDGKFPSFSQIIIDVKELLPRTEISPGARLAEFLLSIQGSEKISEKDSSILSTRTQFNIDILPKHSKRIIINIERINNIRHINQYFMGAYEKVKTGGWIVGNFIALEDDWDHMRNRMPRILFLFLYPLYFVIHRIIPKIPRLKNVYYAITKGNNQKLSKAEIYGRLAFAGFQVVEEDKFGTTSYFLAQKVRSPYNGSSPSSGPIVKLERIGYRGERITIFKFRTMHRYSEFIQADLYKMGQLENSGDKIVNDFRISKYGRILRKYWIDELPQLLNWFRGEISLVGVRALSEAKFNIYSEELKVKRILVKPGLIPPFYADMPSDFQGMMKSESIYISRKMDKPLTTDLIYFSKSLVNILFRGARSS